MAKTTKLKGRPPILTCQSKDQPVVGGKFAIEVGTLCLGWFIPRRRDPSTHILAACVAGRAAIIGVYDSLAMDMDRELASAERILRDYHMNRGNDERQAMRARAKRLFRQSTIGEEF